MKAHDFDRKFGEGVEHIVDDSDPVHALRPNSLTPRETGNFLQWMVEALVREAKRLGVTRRWVAERLERRAY